MDKLCRECDARCCRYFCFEIDKPETYQDFENIRWYMLHEGISVHIDDEGDWCILIDNRCRNLAQTPEGLRCSDYDNRPLICRRYSPDSCDRTRGGYDFEEQFDTAAQLEAYARRMLGDHWFEQERTSARAALEARPGKPRKLTKRKTPAKKTKRV